MTDRKQSLTELLGAVEAGAEISDGYNLHLLYVCFPAIQLAGTDNPRFNESVNSAVDAFHGSLDAAKALFEAVAMDHWRITHMWGDFDKWVVNLTHREGDWENKRRYISVEAQCPARALLIAILKTLIAQDDAQ